MAFSEAAVRQRRPDSIKRNVSLLRHQSYPPSPVDWMETVIYFLLTYIFIDGFQSKKYLLESGNLTAVQARDQCRRPGPGPNRAESGTSWWQGVIL
jgi:hypothetical protein